MINTIQQQLIAEYLFQARALLNSAQQKAIDSYQNTLCNELANLESLLNHIRAINFASPRELNIERFDLKGVVNSVYDIHQERFASHQLKFYNKVPSVTIRGDKLACFNLFFYLTQFILDQVQQADFISIEAQQYNKTMVAIYVDDNGIYADYPTVQAINQSFETEAQVIFSTDKLPFIYQVSKMMQSSIFTVNKPSRGNRWVILLPGKALPIFGLIEKKAGSKLIV